MGKKIILSSNRGGSATNMLLTFSNELKEEQKRKNDFVVRSLTGKITEKEFEDLARRIELRLNSSLIQQDY